MKRIQELRDRRRWSEGDTVQKGGVRKEERLMVKRLDRISDF